MSHQQRFTLMFCTLFFSTLAVAGQSDDEYRSMTVRLRDVLKGSDEGAKKEGLQQLEKAYEARGGNVPTDWKLPPEITRLTFFVRRERTADGDTFGVKLMGTSAKKGIIKQLQVVQYPDRIILDKALGVGSWEDEVDFGNGREFQLQKLQEPEPISDGLYLLNVELANGKSTKGWFIVNDLLASDTPSVRLPAVGQTFTTPNPTLKWDDFHSPEYKSYERRAVWLAAWGDTHWETYIEDPSLTEISVGKRLKDGRYSFFVGYREIRRFGDLQLARQSFTGVPFYVKKS